MPKEITLPEGTIELEPKEHVVILGNKDIVDGLQK